MKQYDSLIHQRRSVPYFFLLCITLFVFPNQLQGQAVTNPNQIKGTAYFTNTNSAILDILNPSPGDDEGFVSGVLFATSIGTVPTLSNSTGFSATTPTSAEYEITVESGPPSAGIEYDMYVDIRLDGGNERYFFANQTSPPVVEVPAAPVTTDFSECAGMVEVQFVDQHGAPVTVDGGSMAARIQPTNSTQAQVFGFASGTTSEDLAVRGDSDHRIDVFYVRVSGSDPYVDQIRVTGSCQEFLTVGCDDEEVMQCVIPTSDDNDGDGTGEGPELGQITGQIDMLGEDEHSFGNLTFLAADSGPYSNFRYDTVPGPTPSEGTFLLQNIVPSDLTNPPTPYRIYAAMAFREDLQYEYFVAPYLDGTNGRVEVPDGGNIDLGDTYVMDPGFVAGDILLDGPIPDATFGSCLADLYRTPDSDSNGIPDSLSLGGSSVIRGVGINTLATNATLTARNAVLRALFEGEFGTDPDGKIFAGAYNVAAASLKQENSIWDVIQELRFLDTGTPALPKSYQNLSMGITDNDNRRHEIFPGQTIDVPIRRCFGQLNLAFLSTAGNFYNPSVGGGGGFAGTDFEGNEVDYSVSFSANGTPVNAATAASEGLIVACLPEGTYNFRPFVRSVNPGGGVSTTELPPVSNLEVGCGQVKDVTLGLQVNLDSPPFCATGTETTLVGSATSTGSEPTNVDEIFVEVDGGAPISVCTNCGPDPSFTADVPLAECANQIVVSAEDEFGNVSSTTVVTRLDTTAPTLASCDDLSLEIDPRDTEATVDYAVTATDNCDADRPIVCDIPSGSTFPIGTTTVNCAVADACGNTSTCTFDVDVRVKDPEPVTCISGRAVVSQDVDTQLNEVDMPSTTDFFLEPTGGPAGVEYNNIGFRTTDGLLYGVELHATGNVQIVAIDAAGDAFPLGSVGLPPDVRFDAGDVSPDGSTLFVTTHGQDLYRVDLSALPGPLPAATSQEIVGDDGRVFDWAYDPGNDRLYGCDSDDGQLAALDPTTGLRTDTAVTDLAGASLPSGIGFGAAWLDDGRLACYRNNGEIYEIDLDTSTLLGMRTGIGTDRNDGATCHQDLLGAALEMSSSGTGVPNTIVLDFTFDNLSSIESFSDLTAVADLRDTFGVHGIDWTFTSITSAPAAFADPAFDGFSSFDLIDSNTVLPAGSSATVTVTIELLTLGNVDPQGDFCSQTTVTGLTADGRSYGDVSTPGFDSDPNADGLPAEHAPTCANLGQLPFACTGEPLMVRSIDAEVATVDSVGGTFTFSSISPATGIELNNLGFRSTDGFLYAIELGLRGNEQLVRIDASGNVFGLGRPPGLPSNIRFDAGDVSADGSVMYLTATNKRLYSVPLPDLAPVTSVAVTGHRGLVFDWAYNPTDGRLYGGDMTHGQIAILDPSGPRTDLNVAGLPTGEAYGGAWFDAAGRLFLYRNNGEIYEIDLSGPTVVSIQTGPGSNRNDAASCVAP